MHKSRSRGFPARLRLPTIAVFIDAENVSDCGIRSVFAQLESDWNPTFRRAYGCAIFNRKEILRDHGILPIEVVPNSPGKNAADIALVIDAMSELYAGRADAFCIVSGDGDFTRLALTIKEKGIPILVFG